MESPHTGFLQPRTTASSNAASIGSTHVNNILQNYSHEQVVHALMTQLREKETQLATLSEQRKIVLRHQKITEENNMQLKGRIDLHSIAAAEKDKKIAQLEEKLAHRKKDNASVVVEAKLNHLAEMNAESKRIIQERDGQLSQLRPILKELKAKVDEYDRNADVQLVTQLEGELDSVKAELVTAQDENLTLCSSIEEMEKKLKGKEWMVKSLQDDSNDQRSRENHLLTHIQNLNEKIETYETKFEGKGTDVPMVLAKLKDYEVRVKDLQSQVRRLTNKKLNELVVRSSPLPHYGKKIVDIPTITSSLTTSRSKPLQDDDENNNEDNESEASDNSYLSVDSEQFEEEEATLISNGTDDMDEQCYAKSVQDEDVLSDFLSDVRVGIESLQTEGLCCAQVPAPNNMASPLNDLSSSSRTFASRNQSDG